MCGIAALFGLKQTSQIFSSIVPMSSIISHRGPDDEGYAFFSNESQPLTFGGKNSPWDLYSSNHTYIPKSPFTTLPTNYWIGALGHRRLSIVDTTSAGHQPMCTQDGSIWISYNGEVYNYIEIRQELSSLGYTFKTNSDTEVILASYQLWGENCLHKFNGMFAFIIYDMNNRFLFAARDRFGVKPLYIWKSPQGFFAFASEIKQFTVLPDWNATLNGQRCYDFLVWGVTDHIDETLFFNVKQLRGGEKFTWKIDDENSFQITPWYELKSAPFKGSFIEASSQFYQLLNESVRLRLRADVNVGTCLSGGLDSSSIVCLINQQLFKMQSKEKQKTFSACSHIQQFDEKKHIDTVVNHCGLEAHYCYPSLDELFKQRKNLVWHQDEPFGSTSIFAQWEVFKLSAGQKTKVILDGQGADEQLAGYHLFFGSRFYELIKNRSFSMLLKEIEAAYKQHGNQTFKHAIKSLIPESLINPIKHLLGKTPKNPSWINLSYLNAKDINPFPYYHKLSVNDCSHLMLTSSHLPMLLHWEDRNSMAHSIESRTPFLDYRLVEFIYSLPSSFKLGQGTTKKIMRDAMRHILPEPIRTRSDKIGFATPEEVWIREESDTFRKALKNSIETCQDIFCKTIPNPAEDIISGKKPFNFLVWRLISFGDWIDCFKINHVK